MGKSDRFSVFGYWHILLVNFSLLYQSRDPVQDQCCFLLKLLRSGMHAMLLLGLRTPVTPASLTWSSQRGSEGMPGSALVSAKPACCFLGQSVSKQRTCKGCRTAWPLTGESRASCGLMVQLRCQPLQESSKVVLDIARLLH